MGLRALNQRYLGASSGIGWKDLGKLPASNQLETRDSGSEV